jgi:hypothetical protein
VHGRVACLDIVLCWLLSFDNHLRWSGAATRYRLGAATIQGGAFGALELSQWVINIRRHLLNCVVAAVVLAGCNKYTWAGLLCLRATH